MLGVRIVWVGGDSIIRGNGDRGEGRKNSAIGDGTDGIVLEGDGRDGFEENVSNNIYDRHRAGVWLVTLAIFVVRLTLGRVVEWMASLLCLSYAYGRRISHEHPLGWGRLDCACFFRGLFRAECAAELEILAHLVRDFHENETLVSVRVAEVAGIKCVPMPILEFELIAQNTLLSRGNSTGGSVCKDDRHSSGVGNDYMDGGDDSDWQSQKNPIDFNRNVGSGGLKDSDDFNDDRSFARMCNGERDSDYDGGVRTASRR